VLSTSSAAGGNHLFAVVLAVLRSDLEGLGATLSLSTGSACKYGCSPCDRCPDGNKPHAAGTFGVAASVAGLPVVKQANVLTSPSVGCFDVMLKQLLDHMQVPLRGRGV
jgi:hypothetical protein